MPEEISSFRDAPLAKDDSDGSNSGFVICDSCSFPADTQNNRDVKCYRKSGKILADEAEFSSLSEPHKFRLLLHREHRKRTDRTNEKTINFSLFSHSKSVTQLLARTLSFSLFTTQPQKEQTFATSRRRKPSASDAASGTNVLMWLRFG